MERVGSHRPLLIVYVAASLLNKDEYYSVMHRVTATQFRPISMPAGFRHHLVGKTLRNVRYSTVT